MLIFYFAFILLSVKVSSHGIYMTQSDYCSRTLQVGTTIMNNNVALSTGRTMVVSRGGTALSSGDVYVPGESLTVTISTFTLDMVFEARGK